MKRADILLGHWYVVRHVGEHRDKAGIIRIEKLYGKLTNQCVATFFGERPTYNVNLADIVRPYRVKP